MSEECSVGFRREATRIEQALVGKQLPTGKTTAAEKDVIFGNRVLNDVGACYWIRGRAAKKLHRTDQARGAFSKVLEYPHARIWDPNEYFWSPAEDAKYRLKDLSDGSSFAR